MKINHNISALNAYRNLAVNNSNYGKKFRKAFIWTYVLTVLQMMQQVWPSLKKCVHKFAVLIWQSEML